jgi:hypothetical protein
MTATARGLTPRPSDLCPNTDSPLSIPSSVPAAPCASPIAAKRPRFDCTLSRALSQIAAGYFRNTSGNAQRMYRDEMMFIAREACDAEGILYPHPV